MKGQVLALLGLALLLAACGGSGGGVGGGGSGGGGGGGGSDNGNGGGGGSNPSSITLTVEDPEEDFLAAAYQVGTGSWTAIDNWNTSGDTKTFTFSLNGETKYGVAVRCRDRVTVIQATSGELANPKIVCSRTDPGTISFTVEVQITGIQVANGDKVCVNEEPRWCSSSLTQGAASATVQVSDAPAVSGKRDLLITLKRQDTSTGLEWVEVAKVERDKEPQNGDTIQVELKDSDRRNPSAPLTIPSSAPSGYMYFPVAFISYGSANGTASGSVNASFTQYRPVSGFGGGDLYGAFILASRSNAELMSIKLFSSGAPSLEFAAPWDDNGLTVNKKSHPTVNGLNRNENDLKGYAISLLSGQLYYNAFLSKGWLGGDTSYTLPDLSDANLLNYDAPQNGDQVSIRVTALLSNITVLTTDPLGDLGDPSIFRHGDYFKIAQASTSFTVDENDSNPISFP